MSRPDDLIAGPGFDFADFELLNIEVRPIGAADTRPLRQCVLRPHQSADELVFDGDDHPDALHVGAFHGGQLLGIASVAPAPMPGTDAPAWQLRGMAVLPGVRRQGVGRQVLDACLTHLRAHRATMLWCNGRTPAMGFYTRLGFTAVGEEFVVPHSGPHYVLTRAVLTPSVMTQAVMTRPVDRA